MNSWNKKEWIFNTDLRLYMILFSIHLQFSNYPIFTKLFTTFTKEFHIEHILKNIMFCIIQGIFFRCTDASIFYNNRLWSTKNGPFQIEEFNMMWMCSVWKKDILENSESGSILSDTDSERPKTRFELSYVSVTTCWIWKHASCQQKKAILIIK